jgi:ATP dependent DNA ligase domain
LQAIYKEQENREQANRVHGLPRDRIGESFSRQSHFSSIIAIVLQRSQRPIRLSRRSEPFDSDDFVYELKIDGFRALAHIHDGQGELISRNGNVFHGFADLAEWIAKHLRIESAVLDGEIACVDRDGRPVSVIFSSGVPSVSLSRLMCCF